MENRPNGVPGKGNPQILLVTGGSQGIGAAVAGLAARRGFAVCINYREQRNEAEKVRDAIRQESGTAIAVRADVGCEPDVVRLFETVDHELGRVTALVNNAGTLERQSRLDAIDSARLQRVFTTNVIGTFLCAREAVRRMSFRYGGQGGCIVNISSKATHYGSPGEYIDYAASKGAVETLTVGLAREVAEEGIRVNGVRPGHIYTALHAKGGEPDRVDRVKLQVPMKRGGRPEEVAEAVLWLLSSQASYVTGAFIDVTGGR